MSDTPLRHTPLYDEHLALKARMVPFTGYALPVQYTGIVDEHTTVRTAVGLFDVSHMGELTVDGPDALRLVDGLVTNDMQSLADGQCRYTLCCNEAGFPLDDLIVYRVRDTRVLIVCNASNRTKIVDHFTTALAGKATVTDISDDTALIAVQGPKAMKLLREAGCDPAVADLPPFHFGDTRLLNVPVTVSRTGYTGEDGAELMCPPAQAAELWRGLLAMGAAYGARPCGLGARNTLRLECKMALYGNDIDESTPPLAAGLGWAIKLDKGPFVGRDAIAATKAAGLTEKLVGFEVTDKAIARDGWEVIGADGAKVGRVTSASPSPTLGRNVGLAYLPVGMSELGTALRLRDPARGREAAAVVVKTPFYKRAR